MRFVLVSALLLVAPVMALAETNVPAKPPAKTVKPVKTVKTAKVAPADKPVELKKRAPISRAAAKAVEEVTPIDDEQNVKLSEQDLEIAKRIYVGTIPCELGASVTIKPNEKRPGFFLISTKGAKFQMHPVESRTGAIRLEDPRAGAMWLQLGNKSMLMSQKLGQRLADECMSQEQLTFADELKKNPAPSLLGVPKLLN